jgi:hypothetical protein
LLNENGDERHFLVGSRPVAMTDSTWISGPWLQSSILWTANSENSNKLLQHLVPNFQNHQTSIGDPSKWRPCRRVIIRFRGGEIQMQNTPISLKLKAGQTEAKKKRKNLRRGMRRNRRSHLLCSSPRLGSSSPIITLSWVSLLRHRVGSWWRWSHPSTSTFLNCIGGKST